MPCAFVPSGYRAVLIGQAQDIQDLGTFSPLEVMEILEPFAGGVRFSNIVLATFRLR